MKFNKILGIYFLLFIYTGVYYYIISIELQFLLKIILKLFLLGTFLYFGVSLGFISHKKLNRLMKI